jgi:hypothetical protein
MCSCEIYQVFISGNIKEKLKLTLWQRLLEENLFACRNIRPRIFYDMHFVLLTCY